MAMTMAQGFALFSTRSTKLFLSKEYTNRGRRNEGRKRVRACLGSANMLCTSMPKKRSLIEKHQVKKTQDKTKLTRNVWRGSLQLGIGFKK